MNRPDLLGALDDLMPENQPDLLGALDDLMPGNQPDLLESFNVLRPPTRLGAEPPPPPQGGNLLEEFDRKREETRKNTAERLARERAQREASPDVSVNLRPPEAQRQLPSASPSAPLYREREATPRVAGREEQGRFDRITGSMGRGLHLSDLDQDMFTWSTDLTISADEREQKIILVQQKKRLAEAQAPPSTGGSIFDIFTDPAEAIPQVVEDVAGLSGPLLKAHTQAGVGAAAGAVMGSPLGPPGIVTGAAIGGSIGMLQYWYRQGYGAMIGRMVEEEVPFETAQVVAGVLALPYAAIEKLQLGRFMKYLPDGMLSAPMRKALSVHANDTVVKVARAFFAKGKLPGIQVVGEVAGDTAVQIGQEMAQEVLQVGSQDVAYVVDRLIGEGKVERAEEGAYLQALKGVWEMSGALAVLSGAARGVGAGLNRRQETKYLKTVVEGLSDEGRTILGIDLDASVGQAMRQLRKNRDKIDQALVGAPPGHLGDTGPVISEEEQNQLRYELQRHRKPETGEEYTNEEIEKVVSRASSDLNNFEQVTLWLSEQRGRVKIERYEDERISFIRAEKEAPFEAALVNSQGNATGSRVIVEKTGRGTKATITDKNNRPVRSINKSSYDEVLRQLQYEGDEHGALVINDQNIELAEAADEAVAVPAKVPEARDPSLRQVQDWVDPEAKVKVPKTVEVEGPAIGRDVSASVFLHRELGRARRTTDLQEREEIMRGVRQRIKEGGQKGNSTKDISQDMYDKAVALNMGPVEVQMPELDMEAIEGRKASGEREERVAREERARVGIPEQVVTSTKRAPTPIELMEGVVGTSLREELEPIDERVGAGPRTYDDSEPSPVVVQLGEGLPRSTEPKATVRDTEVALNRGTSGYIKLVGATIEDAETLGRAFEPLRNKGSEWTYLVLRDKASGEILSIDAHSFLLPGEAPGAKEIAVARRGEGKFIEHLRQRVSRLKARTGVSDVVIGVVHNHPGGKAQPSPEDIATNTDFVAMLDKIEGVEFGEHTIIDTGEATTISRDNTWRMYDIYSNKEIITSERLMGDEALEARRARAREQDPLYGAYRRNPDIEKMFSILGQRAATNFPDAEIGQYLKNDQGRLALAVILDASNNVRAALPFDVNMLKNPEEFKPWSRNRRVENGGRRLIAYYGSHDTEQQLNDVEFKALVLPNIQSGDLFDAIYVPKREEDYRQAAALQRVTPEGAFVPADIEIPKEAVDRAGPMVLREEAAPLEEYRVDVQGKVGSESTDPRGAYQQPFFYNSLLKVLDEKMPVRARKQDVLGILKKVIKAKDKRYREGDDIPEGKVVGDIKTKGVEQIVLSAGVKQDQLNDTKFEEWLEQQPDVVTKKDVLAYVAEATPKIGETIIQHEGSGTAAPKWGVDGIGDPWERYDTEEEAQEVAAEAQADYEGEWKRNNPILESDEIQDHYDAKLEDFVQRNPDYRKFRDQTLRPAIDQWHEDSVADFDEAQKEAFKVWPLSDIADPKVRDLKAQKVEVMELWELLSNATSMLPERSDINSRSPRITTMRRRMGRGWSRLDRLADFIDEKGISGATPLWLGGEQGVPPLKEYEIASILRGYIAQIKEYHEEFEFPDLPAKQFGVQFEFKELELYDTHDEALGRQQDQWMEVLSSGEIELPYAFEAEDLDEELRGPDYQESTLGGAREGYDILSIELPDWEGPTPPTHFTSPALGHIRVTHRRDQSGDLVIFADEPAQSDVHQRAAKLRTGAVEKAYRTLDRDNLQPYTVKDKWGILQIDDEALKKQAQESVPKDYGYTGLEEDPIEKRRQQQREDALRKKVEDETANRKRLVDRGSTLKTAIDWLRKRADDHQEAASLRTGAVYRAGFVSGGIRNQVYDEGWRILQTTQPWTPYDEGDRPRMDSDLYFREVGQSGPGGWRSRAAGETVTYEVPSEIWAGPPEIWTMDKLQAVLERNVEETADQWNLYGEARDQLRQIEARRPNQDLVGDIPFKRSWTELFFKRALDYAVEMDASYLAWPSTQRQVELVEGWGKMAPDDPKQRMVRRVVEEWPRFAKKHLSKIDKESIPQKIKLEEDDGFQGQVVFGVKLTDKLKESLRERGQSLYEEAAPLFRREGVESAQQKVQPSPEQRVFRARAERLAARKVRGVQRGEYFKTVAPGIRQSYIDKEMGAAPEASQAQKRSGIDRRLKGDLKHGRIKQGFYEYLLEKGDQDDVDRYQEAIEVDAESWFLSGSGVPGIFTNLKPEQVLEIARVEAGDELFTREVAERISGQLKKMRAPREGELLLKRGHVETQLAHLLDRHDGTPPVEELRKVAGAPVKGKTKKTEGMFTRSIEDIKDRVVRGWREMPGQYRWYNDFGAGAKSVVGDENMIEFSGVFAITSSQQPPRGNLADTLHLMTMARKFFSQYHDYDGQSPLVVSGLDTDRTIAALTKYFVKEKFRPDGMKIFSNENQLARIAKFYVTGIFSGGTKTGTYALNTFYRANNTFFPFTVNDVHVARGMGFVRRDIARDKDLKRIKNDDGSYKYVDQPQFNTDDEYRYAQYVLTHIANDLGISPDQAQAAFWFYVKKHEAPSKKDATEGRGDGTYEDAAQFSQPEIDALMPLISLGAPLTNRFTGESIRVDGSRGYQVSGAEVQELEDLSRAQGRRVAVALKPGKLGVTDTSFYTDDNRQPVPMAELLDFYREVERGMVNPKTGKIKALELLAIDHEYEGIEGSWEGREPSMLIRLPYANDQQAEFVAALFGDAFDQQAMAIDNPKLYSPEEADAIVGAERKKLVAGAIFTKEDGTAFSDEEMAAIDNSIDPKDISGYGPYKGLHYSLISERRELKLLNFTDLDEDAFIEDVSLKVIGAIDAGVQGKSYTFRSYLLGAEPRSDEGQVEGGEPSAGYEGSLQEGRHYLRRGPERPDVYQGLIDNLYGPYASSLRRFIDQRGWTADLLTDERDPATGPVSSTRLQRVFDVVDQPGNMAPDPEGRFTRLGEEIDDLKPGDVTGKGRRLFDQIFNSSEGEAPPPPPSLETDEFARTPQEIPSFEPPPGAEERGFSRSLERAGRIAPVGEARYYIPQSNLETRAKVEKVFNEEGLRGLMLMVGDDLAPPTAERTAAGIYLHAYYMDEADRARAANDDEKAGVALERAVDVATLVSSRLTGAAQMVQAANMMSLLTPESIGIYVQRRMDKINEEHGFDKEGRTAFGASRAKKKRILTTDLYARFKALATKAQVLAAIGADTEQVRGIADDLLANKPLTPGQLEKLGDFRDQVKSHLEVDPPGEATVSEAGISSKEAPKSAYLNFLRQKVARGAADARVRLRDQNIIRGGIPVDAMADVVLVGVNKMLELGEGYKSWEQAMRSELAIDISSSDMHKLYNDSMSAYKQDKKDARREFAQLKKIDEFLEEMAADPRLRDSKEVVDIVQAIAAISTANEDARIAIGQEVEVMLRRLEPKAFTDYLTTILHIGRLLAPKTALKNIGGNMIIWDGERLSMMLAASIDRTVSFASNPLNPDKRSARTIMYTPLMKKYPGKSKLFTPEDWIRGKGRWSFLSPELREGIKAGYQGMSPRGLPTLADLPQGMTFDPLGEDYKRMGKVGQTAFKGMRVLEGAMSAELRGFDFAAYMRAYNVVLYEEAILNIHNEGRTFDDAEVRDAWITNWISGVDRSIHELADRYARYVTFQDDSLAANVGKGIKDILNMDREFFKRTKGLAFIEEKMGGYMPKKIMLGEYVLAYPKVPANLISRGLAYSPAGILKAMFLIGQAARKIDSPHSRREGIKALSRSLVGTGAGALVFELAKLGLLSGAEEEEWAVAELKKQVTGEGKYQINLTGVLRYLGVIEGGDGHRYLNAEDAVYQKSDRLYTYDWAQPLSMSVAFAVNAQEYSEKQRRKEGPRGEGGALRETAGMMQSGLSGAMRVMEEQPMLTGLQDLFRSYDRSGSGLYEGFMRVLIGVPTGFVPQMVNQLKYKYDNTSRTTYVPDNNLQTMINKLIYRIPFLSKKLPQAYKTLGVDMPREVYTQGNNSWYQVLFSPWFVTEYNPDPVALMLLEPFEETGSMATIPRIQGWTIKIGGIAIVLNAKDRNQMQNQAASYIQRNMERFIKNGVMYKVSRTTVNTAKPVFVKAKSEDDQLQAMSDIVSQSAVVAKDWFIFNRLAAYRKPKEFEEKRLTAIYNKQIKVARLRRRALMK